MTATLPQPRPRQSDMVTYSTANAVIAAAAASTAYSSANWQKGLRSLNISYQTLVTRSK
ncbi:Hypothetical predicted protein [Scomber scombrus]|uniref:Uncharacterized protein n=1 Tax=Scomber scombrus TaxID=13677 RepID=A0AAV1PEA2_SCOSC